MVESLSGGRTDPDSRCASIRTALTTGCKRREAAEIEAVVDWISQPARLIYDLQNLAALVIEGDFEARTLLFARLEQHHRGHRHETTVVASAIGSLALAPNRDPVFQVEPCQSPWPGALGEIGVAVALATPLDLMRRAIVLDRVSELGDCVGNFEALGHAIDNGEIERARSRVDAFRSDLSARRGLFPEGGPIDGPIGGPGRGPQVGPFGPFPEPCPPALPDLCFDEREMCTREIIDILKRPVALPTGDHVHSDGITQVTANACEGDTIRIDGSGFGATQPANIRVQVARTVDGVRTCEAAEVIRWSDERIDVRLPTGAVSGCVGFLDLDELERQKELTRQANQRNSDLNNLVGCLRWGPIRAEIPTPSSSDCAPCRIVNRVAAGPPIIGYFGADATRSGERVPDAPDGTPRVDPGDLLDLVWVVSNADTVVINRISSTGPFVSGPQTGSRRALGVASHVRPEAWIYELTATNRCGTVSESVVIVASKTPDLTLLGLEVTQAIQNSTNTVRYVAEKPTVVRAMWNHGLDGFDGDALDGVTGTLDVIDQNGRLMASLHPINGSSPTMAVQGASIKVPANPKRENVDETLNFLIPAALCSETVNLRPRASIDGYGAASGRPQSGAVDRGLGPTTTVTFLKRSPIDIEVIRIRWRGIDATLRTPTMANCRTTWVNAMQRVAAPLGTIVEHPTSPLRPGGTHDGDAMDDLLDDWDSRHRCEIRDAIASELRLPPSLLFCFDVEPSVLNALGESFWALMPGSYFAGRAADIPASTMATPARTAIETSWTDDGLDTKAAHEMMHCLDQAHVEVRGDEPGADDADELSDRSQVVDVGFDIARNQTITGAADIMSYSSPRWTHPARWNRVFSYVGAT